MIKIVDDHFNINKTFYKKKLERVVKEIKLKGAIGIKLGTKRESKNLNKHYLNRDYPTDVLSFPIQEKLPDGFYCGDIFICFPIAVEQAKKNKRNIKNELLTLMIHGLLHLAGYDHGKDSGEMVQLQEQLLNKINNE